MTMRGNERLPMHTPRRSESLPPAAPHQSMHHARADATQNLLAQCLPIAVLRLAARRALLIYTHSATMLQQMRYRCNAQTQNADRHPLDNQRLRFMLYWRHFHGWTIEELPCPLMN